MNWSLRNTVRSCGWFGVVLVTLGLIGITEVIWLCDRQRSIKVSQRQVQRVRKELREFDKLSLALTEVNAAALKSELVALENVTAQLRSRLMPSTKWLEVGIDNAATAERTDGYFEIATFVERVRERARSASVLLSPDERFGFTEYAHSGPTPHEQDVVSRQRAIIEVILEALFDAQPQELISVVREPARLSAALDEKKPVSGRAGTAAESAFIDPRLSLRRGRQVETTGTRLSFMGQTVTLRLFLTSLLRIERPLSVRSVEIQPMPKRIKAGGVALTGTDPVLPLVEQSLSRFTVIIEAYEFPTPGAFSG